MFGAKDTLLADLIRDCLHCSQRIWRRPPKPLFDSYRPEKHYMRGPGPKHQAKSGGAWEVLCQK
jgi:hypothetical protein